MQIPTDRSLLMMLVITFVMGIITAIITAIIDWRKVKEGTLKEPNYLVLFVMGAALFPPGLILAIISLTTDIPYIYNIAIPLFSLGLIYLIIGWVNRDKWKKNP